MSLAEGKTVSEKLKKTQNESKHNFELYKNRHPHNLPQWVRENCCKTE